MDFLMQESCSNKSLLCRDMLRMFMAGSAFEVMQHSSMYPSPEEGRLSRQEQQCCQGFDFVAWQFYFDRSASSPADQGFATNQGCLAAVQFLSSTAGYSLYSTPPAYCKLPRIEFASFGFWALWCVSYTPWFGANSKRVSTLFLMIHSKQAYLGMEKTHPFYSNWYGENMQSGCCVELASLRICWPEAAALRLCWLLKCSN